MEQAIGGILPIIVSATAILLAITVHEFSHGFAAYLQGDMTARDHGRLTLNPIAHIDLVGTILIPGLLILSGSPFVVGWAKPVPFNPHNLRSGRFGAFLVGLAGPLSNFLMFIAAGLFLKIFFPLFPSENFLILFLAQLLVINLILGIFNLIPVAPLDGSKILFNLLPVRFDRIAEKLDLWGPYLLILLLVLENSFPLFGRLINVLLVWTGQILNLPL
ncbi:MAG: site-2 protease family protein [Candidatus Uhrbacteria bacterium]|nr:site-2 protease family protein [Candidatus Uhrbacteria bacterium]